MCSWVLYQRDDKITIITTGLFTLSITWQGEPLTELQLANHFILHNSVKLTAPTVKEVTAELTYVENIVSLRAHFMLKGWSCQTYPEQVCKLTERKSVHRTAGYLFTSTPDSALIQKTRASKFFSHWNYRRSASDTACILFMHFFYLKNKTTTIKYI